MEALSNNLDFFSFYCASKQAVTGLTVSVDVWKHLTSTNTSSQIVTAGSATEVGGGLYRYQLSSASVTGEGEYICIFKTSSTTPDQQHIPSIWCVQKAGVEYLDAAVTSRASATDYTSTRAGYLDRLDAAITSRQATGNVTVGAYAAGQDPATLVWGASTRTLSAFGFSVTVGTNSDKTGYALAVTPPTAQQVWDTLTSATTTAGSVGKRIADNLDATISSRQATGNVTIAGYAAGQDPVTLTGVTTTRAAKLDNLDVAVSTGAAPAIWNYLAASATTASSLGKLLVDNVNATIASRMATFTYTAPDNTSVGTILSRTDVATSTRASATDYTTVRAAKLDNLDATVSSRFAPDGLTSLQADVTAIKTPVVANIDATISSRLASASYTGTSITSLQADVTAIKATVDTNLNATISSRLAASAYVTAIGTGATSYSVTIYEPGTLVPISGAEAWVTSDSAGVVVIAGTLRTSATGVVTFLLDSGTYYLWVQASGWNFSNPQAFVVS
jgi:hypothetical protein